VSFARAARAKVELFHAINVRRASANPLNWAAFL